MRVTVTVQLDPGEQITGQPQSAEVSMRAGAVHDLLVMSRAEAANVYLPAGWCENTAAMVAARVFAAGLGLTVPVVVDAASVKAKPPRPVAGV